MSRRPAGITIIPNAPTAAEEAGAIRKKLDSTVTVGGDDLTKNADDIEPAKRPTAPNAIIKARAQQLAALAHEQKQTELEHERSELQLQLFPHWPEDRRGAPNDIVRAAIFGVVKRGRRVRVTDLPIAAPAGNAVTLNGWRLDQADFDVWLEVMHLARETKPGHPIRFSLYTMLRKLGRKGDGTADRDWLRLRLKQLSQTSLEYDNELHTGVSGALLLSFDIDKKSKECVVETNPKLRPLFDNITHLDVERRRDLGSNQLAKAIHAMISSHAKWLPMKVETIMHRVGAEYAELRFFRRDLKAVLSDLESRGWIDGWTINTGDLVMLALRPSPTQQRLLDRNSKQLNKS